MAKTRIVFLPVPGSLEEDLRHFSPEREIKFKVNPSILLPVELEGGMESLENDNLNWEMILSGMLKLISGRNGNHADYSEQEIKPGDLIYETDAAAIPDEWADYYRAFVLTVKPEIFHEFMNASIVKAGNGEFDLALEISAVLEGLFPLSPGVLLNKALILEQRAEALEKKGREDEKKNAEVLDAYEKALAAKPSLSDTFFNAGFFFMHRRDFARAKDCFLRYIEAGEDSEKIKQAQKIVHDINAQGLDDESFREAYDSVSAGNEETGLVKIREFIEKYPLVWNGWFVLGWALRKLGRYSGSLEAFEKAAELGGWGSDIKNETAICLMEQGDLKGAKRKLEEALREDPENIKIISNLGVLAMKAGNKTEADAFFRTVLELDPSDPLAKHFIND